MHAQPNSASGCLSYHHIPPHAHLLSSARARLSLEHSINVRKTPSPQRSGVGTSHPHEPLRYAGSHYKLGKAPAFTRKEVLRRLWKSPWRYTSSSQLRWAVLITVPSAL
ncbi:hypothetical protein E6O75_ATG11706 [Venturia nashicola]|uniref:Uncharacterized protein n=1 Tax=Venturia nashicola TaxID=86259 RepID=A0A4Z1NPR1_9PEZI|nr:hypothetical protein E6O75_ATG11706 [Venturia nashicola]